MQVCFIFVNHQDIDGGGLRTHFIILKFKVMEKILLIASKRLESKIQNDVFTHIQTYWSMQKLCLTNSRLKFR